MRGNRRRLSVHVARGYGCKEASGPGDLRLRLGSCEMTFSAEEVGWQVCFEGDATGQDTDALVAQIARQVEEFTEARLSGFATTSAVTP